MNTITKAKYWILVPAAIGMTLIMMGLAANLLAQQQDQNSTQPQAQPQSQPESQPQPQGEIQPQQPAAETPNTVPETPTENQPAAPAETHDLASPKNTSAPVTDPNSVKAENLELHTQSDIPPLEKISKYWQHQYHPQVSAKIFALIKYPYYPGGITFAPEPVIKIEDQNHLESDQTAESKTPPAKTEIPSTEPKSKNTQNKSESPAEKTPESADQITKTSANNESQGYRVLKIIDLIYQWRQMNESEGTILEIVRSIELTKTSTNIYRLNPALAIQTKRIVGQIGVINGRIDLTQQQAIADLSQGHCDREAVSKLEKLIADLKSQLDALALQNDKIGVALGIGAFDRIPPWRQYSRNIDYSHLASPATDLPNTLKK